MQTIAYEASEALILPINQLFRRVWQIAQASN